MKDRKEKILNDLREEKEDIRLLIKNDMNVIHERRKSLSKHRKNINEINDLIRKLVYL